LKTIFLLDHNSKHCCSINPVANLLSQVVAGTQVPSKQLFRQPETWKGY